MAWAASVIAAGLVVTYSGSLDNLRHYITVQDWLHGFVIMFLQLCLGIIILVGFAPALIIYFQLDGLLTNQPSLLCPFISITAQWVAVWMLGCMNMDQDWRTLWRWTYYSSAASPFVLGFGLAIAAIVSTLLEMVGVT